MNKMVKRCNVEGIICKGLRRSAVELQLALIKMREQHDEAQKWAYGYMGWIANADAEAYELKEKVAQLRKVMYLTCSKCRGYNDYLHNMIVEAEMFIGRQAFAEAEARYEDSVSPEKYAEMFYE